jgi:hypothetical protein
MEYAGRAIPDRRDFMRGGFSGLRVASFSSKAQSQWQSAHQNGAKAVLNRDLISSFSFAAPVSLESVLF